MIRTERIGDWDGVHRLVSGLNNNLEKAQKIALKRWGLLAERIAVKHISSQDLNWENLKPKTISAKVRLGYSEKTLISSSTYFRSITSYVQGDKVYAGVKREAKYSDGESIANIAAIHEFGSPSRNIPARPLWQPTLSEVKEQIEVDKKLNPVHIFFSLL